MKSHNLIQGTPEWHAYRAEHFNASDAPVMMNCSSYKTRTELLNEFKTGLTQEIDAATQRRFNDGHRFEELARPLAEKIVGEDLYPVVGSSNKLSASFDGLTLDEAIAFEHKTLNDLIRSASFAEELPLMYRVQMEQQLYVSGAEKCLFLATTWDNDELVNEKHFWYFPDLNLREMILAGWDQFQADLETHEVKAVEVKPAAEEILQLPAIVVQVAGGLTASNLPDVIVKFDDFLANANTVLKTDEDFANGEATAKFARETARKLKLTGQQIIDQVPDISEAKRVIDLYAGKFDVLGLQLEKLVKTEKENRKISIMNEAVLAWSNYKTEWEYKLPSIRLTINPDFAGAMKGKRTIESLENAVASELANTKIEADKLFKDISAKLTYLNDVAKDYKFLFNDLQSIIYMTKEHYEMTVRVRIESHKKAEADKLEAQRLQIEAEAKRKAEAEQAAKLEAEREKIRQEEQAKIAEEARLETLRIAEEKLKAEANKPTPEKLRAQAKEMSIAAEYADRNEDRNREKNAASDLMKKADELEKELQETSFYDDSFEVMPTVIEDPLPSTRSTRQRIIWAVVGEFDISYREAEKLIFDEFYFNEEMEEDEMEAV